jgi:hypothetical protein
MKIRRFSELDLARFVALARGPLLADALRRYDADGGSWSYEPVRASTADMLGASTPLYGSLEPVSWDQIKKQITAACKKGSVQIAANVEVGGVLFGEARRLSWKAAKIPMGRLPIGSGESVRYWSDVVLADQDNSFVAYFDHRRANGATSVAIRNVIFSMQHIWVRERNPDLADAGLAIVRFSSGLIRKMSIEFHGTDPLLSYEELDARVRLVYEMWARILEERAATKRKAATSDLPDLFESGK